MKALAKRVSSLDRLYAIKIPLLCQQPPRISGAETINIPVVAVNATRGRLHNTVLANLKSGGER